MSDDEVDKNILNGCDLLSIVFCGIVKGKSGDSHTFFTSDDLQTFHDSLDILKLFKSSKDKTYGEGKWSE